MSEVKIITIDGPSGVGKGTVSRAVADRLGFHLLDSGALYRLCAVAALKQSVSLDDDGALAELARSMQVRFDADTVWLGAEDVSGDIRRETVGEVASKIAAIGEVRAALLDKQRAFAAPPGLVADGRDMGSTIFPAAAAKVFLDASAAERAQRRYKQLKGKGISVSLTRLFRDICERDERDRSRSASPLRPAPGAAVIDTTELSIDAVVVRVFEIVERSGIDTRPQE